MPILTPLHRILSWLLALVLAAFSIPKLSASDVSLRLFGLINGFTGFEGRWFMYFTGAMELSVAALLAISLVWVRGYPLWLFSILLVVGTMVGAIATEVLVRPGEDMILLSLAITMFAVANWLLWQHKEGIRTLIADTQRQLIR
jgi:DoxX-like family